MVDDHNTAFLGIHARGRRIAMLFTSPIHDEFIKAVARERSVVLAVEGQIPVEIPVTGTALTRYCAYRGWA
jgi:hypothetical protein